METINILIAEVPSAPPNNLAWQGEGPLRLVGRVRTLAAALKILGTAEIHVLLTDLFLAGSNGAELCRAARKKHPSLKVLGYSREVDRNHFSEMFAAGAHGYLLNGDSQEEILKGVQQVLGNRPFFSSEICRRAIDYYAGLSLENALSRVDLTKREYEVLRLIVGERTNQEIAQQLFISLRTVEAHKRNLLAKTGSRNIAGLVAYAWKAQLFENL